MAELIDILYCIDWDGPKELILDGVHTTRGK